MQPEEKRRQEISYDKALAQLGQSVCPGCERHVDLTNENVDFCPHCGLRLFGRYEKCNARKSIFLSIAMLVKHSFTSASKTWQ